MDFFEKAMKEMQPIYALADFLKVKAPDHIEKEAFYYNEKGEGFLETFYKANPEPVKHEVEGKLFYTNENGETFNVVRKDDFVLENQTRKAETEKDFQEIYNREFEAKDLEDTPENHNLFTSELFNQVEHLIYIHKESTNFEKRDLKTISRANVFLSFLNQSKAPGKIEETEDDLMKYNPTLFHKFGFEFFRYLYNEYINQKEHGKQIRFMNVWKFLSYHELPEYKFNGYREDYIDFVYKNFEFKINKQDPSQNYSEKEKVVIERLRDYFEKNYGNEYKHLKNT
jgi:hypothetical protein